MSLSDTLFTHWYFHVPNLILASLMYTLIGRYVLELLFDFFGGSKDAVILSAFRGITDPVLRLVRLVTPAIVPNGLVIIFSIVWLLALRIAVFLALGAGIKIGA